MDTTKLKITQCYSPCSKYKIETDFLMFESGAGGDFETYIGDKTGTIYRVDMHKILYMNLTLEKLLQPAISQESSAENLRNIPDQVKCKFCQSIFKAMPISISGEVEINATQL